MVSLPSLPGAPRGVLLAVSPAVGKGIGAGASSGFLPVLGAALSSLIESNTVTLSGLVGSPALTISGGQYSKNGAAYSSAATTVTNGDTLKLRVTSPSTAGATASVVATIDGTARTFAVTTAAADTGTPTPTPSLSISGTPGAAMVGGSDTFTPTISGGTAPYALSLASGTLPPGRTVNGSARTVTGTYTAAGTYSYVLRATDSAGVTANLTVNLIVQAAQSLIPWTPAMIGMTDVYEAAVPASILNAAGTQAQPGEGVAMWQSQTSNGRTAVQATAAAMPPLGTSADASPTGVIPITFRGTHQLTALVAPARVDRYTHFAIFRLKAGATGSRYVIGNSGNTSAYNLLQSASTSAGALRALLTQHTFEIDQTERIRSFTQNMQTTGLSSSTIQGREEGFDTTGSGAELLAGSKMTLGSNNANNAGGLLDLFAYGFVPVNLSNANKQRAIAYFAHRAGLASSALDPSQPYFSAPPMVPAGTTSTLDWIEFPAVTAGKQAYTGLYMELQPDSYNGDGTSPATDGTTEPWGFPGSLIASEQARLINLICNPAKPRVMHLRHADGVFYRGLRNIDPVSGLARNIGERYSGQNTAIANLMAGVVDQGGGLWPEYWSPAPHWKTTSKFGGGRLWAGGSYPRTTSLEDIRTSDPTQYAAQIDELTTAMINDLEYKHQNVTRITGFGLGNEVVSDVDATYGTWNVDGSLYRALIRSIIPKLRNSAVLSAWKGQPQRIKLHYESYKGLGNIPAVATDTSALSTGLTPLQEADFVTNHYINELASNPDYIRTQASTWIAEARGKTVFGNEREFFTPNAYTDEQRFSRICSWMLHDLNLLSAPQVMPVIHIMKDIAVAGKTGNALGYALFKARLPAPWGQDPSTPGDSDPQIAYGCFDFVKPNWHAAIFVADNIPIGSVMRKVDLPNKPDGSGIIGGIAAVATIVGGKRRLLVANWSGTAQTFNTTLGSAATYNVVTYTATDAAVSAGTVSGPLLSMTFAPYTAYVITEA